ncbi:hypothetical protein ACIRVF_23700 [Kitasatospora sp. NPDC101157]|uniref:hypothetical protein n=1 Tax=Kitasatospora sp. NPDC101157 TaxID=3364098 RepID=UPI0037F9EAFC
MVQLGGEAVRWVDDGCPGVVEVRFPDADGRRWSVIDKTTMFGATVRLDADSPYPVPVEIDCTVLDAGDDDVVTVSTWRPHHLETVCGRSEFRVRREQLRDA